MERKNLKKINLFINEKNANYLLSFIISKYGILKSSK